MLRPNDRNISTQHIATLLGATCCMRLVTLLRRLATWCCSRLARFVQQCCAWACALVRMAKRVQHVAPNNVAICCVQMLWSFCRGLQMLGQQCWDMSRWDVAIVWPGFKVDGDFDPTSLRISCWKINLSLKLIGYVTFYTQNVPYLSLRYLLKKLI